MGLPGHHGAHAPSGSQDKSIINLLTQGLKKESTKLSVIQAIISSVLGLNLKTFKFSCCLCLQVYELYFQALRQI